MQECSSEFHGKGSIWCDKSAALFNDKKLLNLFLFFFLLPTRTSIQLCGDASQMNFPRNCAAKMTIFFITQFNYIIVEEE